MQACVSTWHPTAPHIPLTHVVEQHWPPDWQLTPGGLQAPRPQTPLVQLPEQHWDTSVHASPLGAQLDPATQLPPLHAPEQHWSSSLQGMSSAVQLPAPQTPLVQSSAQHCAGVVHGLPLSVQLGPPSAPPVLLLLDALLPLVAPLLVPEVLLLAVLPPPVAPLLVALDAPVPAVLLVLDEAEEPPLLPQPLPRANAVPASPERSASVTRRPGGAGMSMGSPRIPNSSVSRSPPVRVDPRRASYQSGRVPQRQRYLFVCVNRRPDGVPKGSCAGRGSVEVHAALKDQLKSTGLALLEARACTASCLDVCWVGPAVAVEPDGYFYGRVTLADVPEIVLALREGRRVERLVLPPEDFDEATAHRASSAMPRE